MPLTYKNGVYFVAIVRWPSTESIFTEKIAFQWTNAGTATNGQDNANNNRNDDVENKKRKTDVLDMI